MKGLFKFYYQKYFLRVTVRTLEPLTLDTFGEFLSGQRFRALHINRTFSCFYPIKMLNLYIISM